MTMSEATKGSEGMDAVTAAARAGDEAAFSQLASRHRRELQLHCYRMLGSLQDAEDLVQETFLRAWQKRGSFEGRSTFRAWLYRIATNACLDHLGRRPRSTPASGFEVPWLEPYPDRLLEGIAAPGAGPEEAVVSKETIELAFMVAIQRLAPRPRAILILRDVLDWSAKETAALLETSVASVNSSLQRSRAVLDRHLPERRQEWAPGRDPSQGERELLRRYVEATESEDTRAFVEMMREDAVFAMPPEPGVYIGPEAIVESWSAGGFGSGELGELRCLTTRANMQPAVACYVRRPGDDAHRALALDVIGIEEGEVSEIITFPGHVFQALDLPETL